MAFTWGNFTRNTQDISLCKDGCKKYRILQGRMSLIYMGTHDIIITHGWLGEVFAWEWFSRWGSRHDLTSIDTRSSTSQPEENVIRLVTASYGSQAMLQITKSKTKLHWYYKGHNYSSVVRVVLVARLSHSYFCHSPILKWWMLA